MNAGTAQVDPESPGTGDITCGQLAQRSVAAIRKFWPRVSTTSAPNGQWYDFNGNGILDTLPYVLHGHECLVFFLGGVPIPNQLPVSASTIFGLIGFDKSPTNPFTNNITGSTMYSANRQPPFFEFNAGRLFLDPNSATGIPGYYDSLGNAAVAGGTDTEFLCLFQCLRQRRLRPERRQLL